VAGRAEPRSTASCGPTRFRPKIDASGHVPATPIRDHAQAAALINENPFVISVDDAGLPYVTHLPLHLEMRWRADGAAGPRGQAQPALALFAGKAPGGGDFLGPHAYLSPKVYPDLARVPTWNYLAVHCTVQATLIEDPAAKDACSKNS
jgi:transcriptional regulator